MDTHTEKRINKLHPFIREEMKNIIELCNKNLNGKAKVRITQGLRTIEEQNQLYAH